MTEENTKNSQIVPSNLEEKIDFLIKNQELIRNDIYKMDQKVDAMQQKMESKIDALENKMDTVGRNLEDKIDTVIADQDSLARVVNRALDGMATKEDLEILNDRVLALELA